MDAAWTPRDYVVLIATSTACLCMLILVLGTMLAVLTNRISPDILGTVKVGAGGGLLGFGLILYWIIKVALTPEANK